MAPEIAKILLNTFNSHKCKVSDYTLKLANTPKDLGLDSGRSATDLHLRN